MHVCRPLQIVFRPHTFCTVSNFGALQHKIVLFYKDGARNHIWHKSGSTEFFLSHFPIRRCILGVEIHAVHMPGPPLPLSFSATYKTLHVGDALRINNCTAVEGRTVLHAGAKHALALHWARSQRCTQFNSFIMVNGNRIFVQES